MTLCLILTGIMLAPGARAASYPVTSENVVTGTTTGISGVQNPDGSLETLTEANAANPSSYPSTQWLITGGQPSGTFPGGIQNSDDTWIQYREGATGATTTTVNHPSSWGSCGFTNPDQGRLQDNLYATSSSNGVQCVYTTFGFALPSGSTVTKVEMGHDSWTSGNDQWTLTVSWDGGTSWCTGVQVSLPGSDINTLAYTDFTSCRAWTPADVNSIASRFTHVVIGGANTNSLDENVVRVTYIPPGNFQLNLRYNWTGVPSGQSQTLVVEGHIADENLQIQALTPPATWNTRLTMGGASDQTLYYILTASEYNGGSPSIRFTDASGSDPAQSDFYLDLVKIVTNDPDSFPNSQWIATGSQPSGTFPGGILNSDDTWIDYREAATGATTTTTQHPASWGSCGFTNPDQGRLQDNLYAISSTNGLQCVYTSFGFSVPAGSAITRVEMGHDSWTNGNDDWTISLSWDGGTTWCAGVLVTLPTSDTNVVAYTDFTSCRSWTPSDVNNVAARFTHTQIGGTVNTNNLDENTVRVTYIPAGNFQLNVRYNWTGVLSGQSQMLVVEGHVSDEGMQVQVLTPPATWTTRLTFTSTTDQTQYYNLTSSEYNGGSPSIRYTDASGAEGIQSDLFLDQVKIVTTSLNYRLEVYQDIPGITGTGFVLRTKGNISTGGENFDVYLRNWSAGSWDLRVSSPFTSTNTWHNVSIPGQDVSGTGLVRIRFLDTVVASDTVRDSLSLDYVAVTSEAAPSLANNGATPSSGNITTSFTFYVRYTDPDNDAPQYVRLRVNGGVYDMVANNSGDTNYVDGKDYHYDLAIGVRGTFTYNFTARAATGNTTVVATPDRQVQVLNRAPAITNPIASDSVHTGRAYARKFNASDADGDTVTWSMATNAAWLAIGSSNGTVWGKAPSAPATFRVNVTASDGFGGTARVNYTLSVTNGAPTITNPISSDTVYRSSAYSRTFAATDPDGDAITWSLVTNATFLAVGASNGTVYGVTASLPSSYYVNVTANDGFTGQAAVNYTLRVVDRGPVITNPLSFQTYHVRAYMRGFNATDPEGDPLTWSLVSNAPWLTMGAGNGTVWGWRPLGNYTYYVNVTVRDAYGLRDYNNYTLAVGDIRPVVLGSGNDSVHFGAFYRRTLQASDGDGDPLLWSLASSAAWLRIGQSNGTLYGRAPGSGTSFYVNVSVDDGLGGVGYRNFTLVLGNTPPVITTPMANATSFRTGFARSLAAFDADGDPLTWSLVTNTTALAIGPSSGNISSVATPPPGVFYLRVTVADGFGGRDSVNFTVAFLNRVPLISGMPSTSARAGIIYAANLTASDPDGDPVTLSLTTNATWLSLGPSGQLSGSAASGAYLVNVTGRDPYGGVAYLRYTLVVGPPAPAAGGMGWLYPWIIPAVAIAAAVPLLFLVVHRRKPKGDMILKAYLFTDKAIVLQELVSDEEEPPVKFRDIFKFLVGGKAAGDHWLDLPPYKVAVVQEGKLHLAAISKLDKQTDVMAEAHKLLLSLLGDEDVKAALPQGEAQPPTTDKRV